MREFILCLGYRGASIKQYFADYYLHGGDVTFELATGEAEYAAARREDWRVTLADTGEDAQTGARIKRIERYLFDDDIFLCTYGDGLADVDLTALLAFHRGHGKVATVTGVHPRARFGVLVTDGEQVERFSEKPTDDGLVSGGFFVFDRRVLDYLSPSADCVLERELLERLARAGELAVFEHNGFWECADTVRDVEHLRGLWESGAAPWRVWDDRIAQAKPLRGGRRAIDRIRAA